MAQTVITVAALVEHQQKVAGGSGRKQGAGVRVAAAVVAAVVILGLGLGAQSPARAPAFSPPLTDLSLPTLGVGLGVGLRFSATSSPTAAGTVYVTGTIGLGGYSTSTFGSAQATAFAATIATTCAVNSTAVAITGVANVTSGGAGHRRAMLQVRVFSRRPGIVRRLTLSHSP